MTARAVNHTTAFEGDRIQLDAFAWMPARPADAVATALPRSGKKGRGVSDNAVLAELRVRFPDIVAQFPPHGGKALHVAIAAELRRRFVCYHAALLGVAEDQVKLSNTVDRFSASFYVDHGYADRLLVYLEATSCTAQAAPRPGGAAAGLCGCGRPLGGYDRTYCRTCKHERNTKSTARRALRRRAAAVDVAPPSS